MTLNKRLDKLEKSLTPKQLVVLWLQEIQSYRNASEYVHYLRSQPESAAPITRLTEQITKIVRESMKGQAKEVISAAVRRSVRDVVFLLKLHIQANFKAMSELRAWRLSQAALAEFLESLRMEFLFRSTIAEMADQVNFNTPFPLEPEIAAAVGAAVRHHVYSWEAIVGEGHVQEWLWDYLMKKGEKELPINAYSYPDGQGAPVIKPDKEKELRSSFKDDSEFELFRSGQDYKNDLASVTDAEYNRHYETIVNGLKELVDCEQVQAGTILYLEMVPIPFLREIPLAQGMWVERQALELAEWGALLQTKGYQVKDEDNRHRLALATIIKEDGKEVSVEEVQRLRQKAVRDLVKFPGRTQEIDNRLYIHFEDYRTWRGRKVKGDLRHWVKQGLLTASWNQWVAERGGEGVATVAGVPVEELQRDINEIDYYSCPQGTEDALHQRERLLEDMRYWRTKDDWKEELIRDWKRAIDYSLVELLAYQQAITSIQKSYFEGCHVLCSDVARDLTAIVDDSEKIIVDFNDFFVDTMELSEKIDLESLHQNATKEANRLIAYIVDMAKAEALDCLGDEKAAIKLAERYL